MWDKTKWSRTPNMCQETRRKRHGGKVWEFRTKGRKMASLSIHNEMPTILHDTNNVTVESYNTNANFHGILKKKV